MLKDYSKEYNPAEKIVLYIAILAFLISGIYFLYSSFTTFSKGDTVSAEITEIYRSSNSYYSGGKRHVNYNYTVYLSYDYNGKNYYRVPYKVYWFTMKEGKTINVNINPDNPEEVYYTTPHLILGGFLTVLGIIFAYKVFVRNNN